MTNVFMLAIILYKNPSAENILKFQVVFDHSFGFILIFMKTILLELGLIKCLSN